MPWWQYRPVPQFKIDRAASAIFGALAAFWLYSFFSMWQTPGNYNRLLVATAMAGLSVFYLIRSRRSKQSNAKAKAK